jgi:hypothetical protein
MMLRSDDFVSDIDVKRKTMIKNGIYSYFFSCSTFHLFKTKESEEKILLHLVLTFVRSENVCLLYIRGGPGVASNCCGSATLIIIIIE